MIVHFDPGLLLSYRYSTSIAASFDPPAFRSVCVHALVTTEVLAVSIHVGRMFFVYFATVGTLDFDVTNQRPTMNVLVVAFHGLFTVEFLVAFRVRTVTCARFRAFFDERCSVFLDMM
jgi:hypothetical protein